MNSINKIRQAIEKLMNQYDEFDYADSTYNFNCNPPQVLEAEIGTKNYQIIIKRREV
tara:strand:- start:943 stop:1113 length:171 start_codon:yes stop_codon:yes gene_type:complete